MALWDLKAKAAGEPLWRTLGALDRFVPGYASGLDIALDDDALLRLYERFTERGFHAAKLKGGRDLHRWDAAGHASVRRGIRAAVATGENLTGLEQYRPLLDADAIDVVHVGNVWGITHFLRVAAVAHSRDLPVSPVAYHANPLAHAAAAVPNHLAFEVQDLTPPLGLTIDQEFADGGILIGDEPGLGIRVDESRISAAPAADPPAATTGPHVRPERAGLRLVPDSSE
jgi:L-alanine-DL-glutamate epimerase-like enolase superfamily enzyme